MSGMKHIFKGSHFCTNEVISVNPGKLSNLLIKQESQLTYLFKIYCCSHVNEAISFGGIQTVFKSKHECILKKKEQFSNHSGYKIK